MNSSTSLPQIIALYSPSPGSGKSTIAAYLAREYGYQIRPFAAPLKRLGMAFLLEFGLEPAEAKRFLYRDKNEAIPDLNCTGRHLLETLGTEWARDCINQDIWPMIWDNQRTSRAPGERIIVDDLRRNNEAALLREAGATIWRVYRPGLQPPTHLSTGGELDGWLGFSGYLYNNGTISDLEQATEGLLQATINNRTYERRWSTSQQAPTS
jgi:hypothetical protein